MNQTSMITKSMRRQLLERRNSLPASERIQRQEQLAKRLIALLKLLRIEAVLGFAAHQSEPDTIAPCRQLGITIYLPYLVDRGRMEFYRSDVGEPLKANRYGIMEPEPHPEKLWHRAPSPRREAVLVPCLAMTRRGERLGYGGGYYDRFLARAKGAATIGILFQPFLFGEMETEPHDIPLDYVLSDLECWDTDRNLELQLKLKLELNRPL